MGGKVYRPIGREWYDKGYWHVFNHPATVEQYLGINGNTPDNTPPLNNVVNSQPNGLYNCFDIDSGLSNKAITYDLFLTLPIDFVIASMPAHITPFKKLCKLHPNKPKLIYQIGNSWTIEAGLAPNVMASAIINDVPAEINFVSYHQEFDLTVFNYRESCKNLQINSFINAYNNQPHFAHDYQLFLSLEKMMPEWAFKSLGGGCRDGAVHGYKSVADTIANSRFIWQVKNGGDGFGHIIHNAFAMGIPPIVKLDYYRGKLAGELMIDGATCIGIDNLSINEIVNKINHYNESDKYETMRANVYNVFNSKVDFNADAESIKLFLVNAK